jgi:acyl carrier protein
MDPLVNGGTSSSPTVDRVRRVFIAALHLNLREEELRYEDKLDETVGLDSVAVLDFIGALEKEFAVTFEPEMLTLEVVRDLPQLAAYIDERTARQRKTT